MEANVATTKKELVGGSSSKTRVRPSHMKKKEKGKTFKTGKGKEGADKGKCFHCNQDGYWKRNCPKYLDSKKAEKATQGKYDLLVVETCLVEYDTST